MKNILVPFELNASSENALFFAAQLAKDFNAQLTVLHVYHIPVIAADTAYYEVQDDSLEDDFNTNLKNVLEQPRFKSLLQKKPDVIIRQGLVTSEIVYTINQNQFDLVVMGIKSHKTFAEKMLSSSSLDMIPNAKVPLLLIPDNAEYHTWLKIAIACDLQHTFRINNLSLPKLLAKTFKADLLLFSVIKSEDKKPNNAEAKVYVEIEEELTPLKHSFYFPADGNLLHGITNFINEHDVNLLVMFPHHHNILERMFREQNTPVVTKNIQIPLLLISDEVKLVAL